MKITPPQNNQQKWFSGFPAWLIGVCVVIVTLLEIVDHVSGVGSFYITLCKEYQITSCPPQPNSFQSVQTPPKNPRNTDTGTPKFRRSQPDSPKFIKVQTQQNSTSTVEKHPSSNSGTQVGSEPENSIRFKNAREK